jgi:hypothetical protein
MVFILFSFPRIIGHDPVAREARDPGPPLPYIGDSIALPSKPPYDRIKQPLRVMMGSQAGLLTGKVVLRYDKMEARSKGSGG